ncbi:hypothetical protein [Flavobacterium undicola]|uniref:hypothetical protein n=1 Tax=Flavobacterium undicola TaxID=1932779 RepID=UPI0013770FBB|nr:hypothetical protein [Flavobacterium undicola]MBA0882426.1 hypothetical protein [Flavobacterium undicola]
MATITLSYDARNVIAKKTIAYILSLGVFKNAEKPRYNAKTEKAIQDAKNGIGVIKVKNVEDLFEKLNS